MKYSKIAIFGPGLIGGSLALAIRQAGLTGNIAVWEREEALLEPIKKSGITPWLYTDPIKTVQDAELVILCTPVGAMKQLAEAMKPGLDPFATVTDVGSVKTKVVRELEPIFSDSARWIGSHPMAGSQQKGFGAAQADLFKNAACIVTPTSATDPEAERTVKEFWTALGCRIFTMSPEEHDRMIAQVSHLPHLAASLVATIPEEKALALAGNGFRDSTRIAAGPADMWLEILMANREEVIKPLDQLIKALEKARNSLVTGEEKVLQEQLKQANHVRNSL